MKKLLFMDRKKNVKNRKKGVEFCNVDKAKIRLQDRPLGAGVHQQPVLAVLQRARHREVVRYP